MSDQPFLRWLAGHLLTTEQFKNTVTITLVTTYCYMAVTGVEVSSEFSMLVGMVLGFYFKKDSA